MVNPSFFRYAPETHKEKRIVDDVHREPAECTRKALGTIRYNKALPTTHGLPLASPTHSITVPSCEDSESGRLNVAKWILNHFGNESCLDTGQNLGLCSALNNKENEIGMPTTCYKTEFFDHVSDHTSVSDVFPSQISLENQFPPSYATRFMIGHPNQTPPTTTNNTHVDAMKYNPQSPPGPGYQHQMCTMSVPAPYRRSLKRYISMKDDSVSRFPLKEQRYHHPNDCQLPYSRARWQPCCDADLPSFVTPVRRSRLTDLTNCELDNTSEHIRLATLSPALQKIFAPLTK